MRLTIWQQDVHNSFIEMSKSKQIFLLSYNYFNSFWFLIFYPVFLNCFMNILDFHTREFFNKVTVHEKTPTWDHCYFGKISLHFWKCILWNCVRRNLQKLTFWTDSVEFTFFHMCSSDFIKSFLTELLASVAPWRF